MMLYLALLFAILFEPLTAITCWEAGFQSAADCGFDNVDDAGVQFRGSDDNHQCPDDNCDAGECCTLLCNTFDGTCDEGFTYKGDHWTCGYGGVDICTADICCAYTCFANFVGTCPEGEIARGEDDGHSCADNNCDESECCQTDRYCSTVFTGTCGDDEVISTTEKCDQDGQTGEFTNCDADRCCENEWEALCQSEDAQSCSSCATYAPCLSSVDPHCIRQEALDCLPCDESGVTQCATCAYDWDINCLASRYYEGSGCQEADLMQQDGNIVHIPALYTGACFFLPPFASQGYYYYTPGVGYGTGCNDDCSSCEDESELTDLASWDDYGPGVCTDEEDYSYDRVGIWDNTFVQTTPVCPNGEACGPEPCVPGTDPSCMVISIFGGDSQCSVANFEDWDTTGDYHAFAFGDATCRQDGSGRSYYRLVMEGDIGTGLIGCTDAECTQDCTAVSLTHGVCSTPDWANGLELVFQVGDEYDYQNAATQLVSSVSIIILGYLYLF